ncbi:hypothetical protein [Streptomyces sp. NPDC059994]|uniref:hypothetical protein n=1 Tax=Streptomyces sp. NPDC059994 TaxID=3347029 RepID=UPI0036BEA199
MDVYKRAWAEADHVADLLRAALVRVGVPEAEAARVRGLVTGSGCAYVELGALRMGSAVKLCEALPLARHSATPVLPADAFG